MYLTAEATQAAPHTFNAGHGSLRAKLERLLAELPPAPHDKTLPWSWNHVELMLPRVDLLLEDLKLWGSSGDDQVGARDCVRLASQRLAAVCEEYVRAMSRRFGCRDVRSLRAIAFCLFYIGESFKQTMGRGMQCPYSALHALWKLAAASGHEADMLSLPVDGMDRMTSIDRLYMRALALAWGVKIELSPAQLHIFDAWIWSWMTALECTEQAPVGGGLRADPDAPFGLSARPADGAVRHVHLSRRELEAVLRVLSAELGAGRTVPHDDHAAGGLDEQRRTLATVLRALLASGVA
jgi:hypothetical protein